MHMTYLMRRRDKGFRVGTSRTHNGRVKPVVGFMQRSRQEHADAAWVVSTHETEGEARAAETTLALKYQVPTLPFVARAGSDNGLVANQALIDRVFSEVECEEGGHRLLTDSGLRPDSPLHAPELRASQERGGDALWGQARQDADAQDLDGRARR